MPASEDYIPLLRELLRDGRMHTKIGAVKAPEGEEHWEIIDGDVYVDVQLSPGREQVLCRLAAAGGMGAGLGFFAVPAVGTEVIVGIPDGDLEADCTILGILGGTTAPDGLSVTAAVIVIKQGGQLLVHDGTAADAVALVKKSEHVGHAHPFPAMKITLPNPPVAGDYAVSVVSPTPSPGNTGGAPNITGTTVLKGK